MAWRDSRKSRPRLLLFAASIAAGVAAVASIGSFSADLRRAVDDQARTLVGADIVVQARRPFTPEDERVLKSLGDAVSHEVRFASMALFPRSQGTRLVQVRAEEGAFPFYGTLDTDPASAQGALRAGTGALVDESLLLQFGESPGCQMKLGDAMFAVAGGLRKAPGESFAFSALAPRVYIPLNRLGETNLLRKGSLASYFAYLKTAAPAGIPAAVKQLEARGFACDTVAKRKKDLGQEMENLYHFLNLTGFVALLLGATAVAGAIHLHIRSRVRSVALLRCLGCTSSQAVTVYLIQTMALALLGSLAGVVAGVGVQALLPKILADFLTVHIAFALSLRAILTGLITGVGFCWLFAMLPLLSLRRVSPLSALRAQDLADLAKSAPDPLRWVFHGLTAAGVTAFAVLQTGSWRHGLSLAGGLAVVLGSLVLVARGIVFGAHRYLRSGWPYVWRQGLSNLYRPGNRTVLLMLSLGLGTFLVLTIFFAQRMLLASLAVRGTDEANIVLFDIGAEQLDGLAALLHRLGAPLLDRVPMVPMRLASLKGRPIQQIRAEHHIKEWVLDRDYRSSYRETLSPTETVIKGHFTGEWSGKDPVPISVEEGIAKDLDVTLGDRITFDIQGVPMDTVVGSIREVDWKKFRTNFFVLFPKGVLEDAPGTFIALSRAANNRQSATLQREVVRQYPGISVLDLQAIVSSVDSILSKVAFVIRFMSLFTLLTGLMILAAALFSSRYERAREEALLRVLGATNRQVFSILVIEFALLGFFAAVTGIVLSVGASYGLAYFVFKVPFVPRLFVALYAVFAMMAITVGAGLAISRQDGRRAPLALLAEG